MIKTPRGSGNGTEMSQKGNKNTIFTRKYLGTSDKKEKGSVSRNSLRFRLAYTIRFRWLSVETNLKRISMVTDEEILVGGDRLNSNLSSD